MSGWSIVETGCDATGTNQYAPVAIVGEGVNRHEDGPERIVAKIVGERTKTPGRFPPDQFTADARKMVAAQEMYEALKALFDEGGPVRVAVAGNPISVDAEIGRARAALAKAEGR